MLEYFPLLVFGGGHRLQEKGADGGGGGAFVSGYVVLNKISEHIWVNSNFSSFQGYVQEYGNIIDNDIFSVESNNV